MIKTIFVIALLSFLSLVLAAEIEESEKGYYEKGYYGKPYYRPRPKPKPDHRPCPCRCWVGRRRGRAAWQCRKRFFLSRCFVSSCHPKHPSHHYPGYKGKQCCDSEESPASPPPTPSVTPSASKTPTTCPCKCGSYYRAYKQCKRYPYCHILHCGDHHEDHHYYGHYKDYRPRRKYECCNSER